MPRAFTHIATGTVIVALTAAVAVQSYRLYRIREGSDAQTTAQALPGPSQVLNNAASDIQDQYLEPLADSLDLPTWDPFLEMKLMDARVDALFSKSLGQLELDATIPNIGFPQADLTEDDNEYVVRLKVPGAEGTSFNVSLKDRSLMIEGDQSGDIQTQESGRSFRREQYSGHFARRLVLPGPVDPESLTSECSEGVLTIRVHKS